MTWTEPPLPPSGIPGVRRGQVLAPGHPTWQRWHDERVWGTMAGFGRHNLFMGDHDPDTGEQWLRGKTFRFLRGLGEHNPEAYRRAHQGMVSGLRGARAVIALSTPALHKVLDSGRVKSGFETNHNNFKGDLSDGDYLLGRRRQEQEHFGYSHDHPVEGRPVYGYLTHDVFADRAASRYGDHSLVISPSVHHRTTWSAADTLDERHNLRPSPLNRPDLHSMPTWMTDPHRRDLGIKQFLRDHEERGGDYMEAQIHGGLPLHHVHYAILRSSNGWSDSLKEKSELGRRLSECGVPWIHVQGHSGAGPGEAVEWDHGNTRRHLGALMNIHAAVTAGAFVSGHKPLIHWHQGNDRYIVELTEPGRNGLPRGQVADLEWGTLHPPQLIDSILSRGYWERLAHPVEAEDILAKVRPVG